MTDPERGHCEAFTLTNGTVLQNEEDEDVS